MRYRRHRMACSCPCVAHRGPRRPRGSNSSTTTVNVRIQEAIQGNNSSTTTVNVPKKQLVHRHSAEKLRHQNPSQGNSCARRRPAQASVGQGTRRHGYEWRGKAGAAGGRSPRRSCFAAGGLYRPCLYRRGGGAPASRRGARSSRSGGGQITSPSRRWRRGAGRRLRGT